MILKTWKRHGIYYARFPREGKARVLSLRTDKKNEADAMLERIQKQMALGKFNLPGERKNIVLSAYRDEYFELKKNSKASSTLYNEKYIAQAFLDSVGDCLLTSINRDAIYRWESKLRGKVSDSTFDIHRRFLHAFFNVAIELDYLSDNPLKKVKKAKSQEKRLYLREDEYCRLLDEINKRWDNARSKFLRLCVERDRDFFDFAVRTGMRCGEIISLQMKDIDWEGNSIHVEKTKTHNARKIPLIPISRSILERRRPNLFSELTTENISKRFRKYADDAGLKGFHLHSLRHTFGTLLINRGEGLLTVKELMGHKDIRTTMIYAKVQDETMRKGINKLVNFGGKLLQSMHNETGQES